MGRTSGRPRRKMRNISTVQAPMPRTETKRFTSSSSDNLLASSSEGTMPSMVFLAKSFIARSFAQDRLAELQHFFGRRRAAVGAERFHAAEDGSRRFARDGLISDGLEEHL